MTDPVERVLQLRKEAAALERLQTLQEDYGVHFYRPHAKQDAFHAAGDKTGRYCRTGNRGGKTKCGGAEDVAWLLGQRVWYKKAFDVIGMRFEGDGRRVRYVARHHEGGQGHPLVTRGIPQRPVKGLLLVNDWDKAKEIFTNRTGSYETRGELFQLLPKDSIAHVHTSRGGHVDQIRVKRLTEAGGGESILFVDTVESWKHARLSAESSDWDFIHLDEPCPEAMFTGHRRGLVDRGGKFWINCTPLDEMWINDEFCPPGRRVVDDAPNGLAFDKLAGGRGSRFVITWTIWDNPYNDDAAIAEFEAGLNREQRACRLSGLPLAMAGMVYKEFVYDMHVLADVPKGWKSYSNPPSNYTVRVAWDVHGARVPQAVLVAATAPDGTVFVCHEMFDEPLIRPCAKRLKEYLKSRFVVTQIIDPRALIVNPVTETADVQDALAEEDLFFDPASKDLTSGISRVKEKLNERTAAGYPTIYFSPELTETLFEFSHYVYDTEKNKPKDEHDHMMENLYRLVLNGLDYVQPPVEEDYNRRRRTVVSGAEYEIPLR